MHADISRQTFSERQGYRAVMLQQGRVVLDADFNEQSDIAAYHDEVRTRDIVGRVGGALPDDPAAPGPFAILASDGTVPTEAGVPWSSLVVTPGRYYVDGVLAESFPPDSGIGWSLSEQPYVRPIAGVTIDGLGEPTGNATRYALYLEASDHGVTADEEPRLRESALGGPDTSVRRQTTWQVRWAPLTTEVCSDLGARWLAREPRRMTVSLEDAPADSDPCSITASGGYQRLENQLYRVQIHDAPADGDARYLWSRENGSVVAVPTDIRASGVVGAVRVAIDREGRDAELDFVVGDLVEVTSTDYQLQRVPGHLARVIGKSGLDLDVVWIDEPSAPTAVAGLGLGPIVRRWEGGPTRLSTIRTLLEDGITIRFPTGGQARTGDYWLISARSVRLAYGLSETPGTVDVPPPGVVGKPQDPVGPPIRIAPLAIVKRIATGTGATWSLEDCRKLFPPLTSMITVDVAGGDGQEALPGDWLDEPLRVVVRNGSRPVEGARVMFTASAGSLDRVPPDTGATLPIAITGPDGVAAVRWQPDAGGPVTQVLTAQRWNDQNVGVDLGVAFTARLSVASQVAFTDRDCGVYAGSATVDDALRAVARRTELRLQGGDGQTLLLGRAVLNHPIRVIVDSACGPVADVGVTATASAGARVREVVDSEPLPGDLPPTTTVDGTTRADGSALFWWQPGPERTDTLELSIAGVDARASIVVSAQREQASGPGQAHPGAHIEKLLFGDGNEFENDSRITAELLRIGIVAVMDEGLDKALAGKPIARVELDLPWSVATDGDAWARLPIGTRTVKLDGEVHIEGERLIWLPSKPCTDWLLRPEGLWSRPEVRERDGVAGRFILDGWATLTTSGLAVNTHTQTYLDQGGYVRHQLPSDDATAGGTFIQWFWVAGA